MSQWMISEDKLDEQQRQFIDIEVMKDNNIWIQGFAGSGKSVLLVHAVHDILKKKPDNTVCIVVFTHSLLQLFDAGMKELRIPAKNVYLKTYHKFLKENSTFDYIFCDEVQDLPKTVLENMKLRANHLIVGGDSNQSIFKTNPATNEPTVVPSEIGNITNATSWHLDTIYRLTKSIIKTVASLIPTMGILSSKVDKTKKDISVRLYKANSIEKEIEYVLEKSVDAISVDESAVIILPTHDEIINIINIILKTKNIEPWERVNNRYHKPDFGSLNKYLTTKNVAIEYNGNGHGNLYNSRQLGKIIIMTYHSSKGLDFDNVFLPFCSSNARIFDKTLFMVGMTRSKLSLTLSYTGNMHSFVKEIEDDCVIVEIDSRNKKNDDLDFDF